MPLDNETDSYVAVKAQIVILLDAMETPLGLVSILEDGDQIDLESISPYQMFYLKQKVTMLHIALNIAVKNMLDIQNWSACCEKAIEVAKDTIGKGGIKSKRTIRNWYMQFRENGKLCSRTIMSSSKENLPPFLLDNLDVVEKLKDYARTNLTMLSIKLMSEYIHDTIIPTIVKHK